MNPGEPIESPAKAARGAVRVPEVGDQLSDVTLRRVDGTAVRLSDAVDGPTIVPIVRYYGCMPCRDFLLALEELRSDADSNGVELLGVGKAADYQAEWLMADGGVNYTLLVDPDEELYAALELGRFPWWRMFDPRTIRNYVRALRRARQGAITNHPLQSPGVIAVDADLRLLMVHRGETLGDYPPAPEVLAAVTARVGR